MNIYELTNSYFELLLMAENPDVDEQAIADTMEGIEGELEIKAENYAKVLVQLEADLESLKTEEERIAKRRRSIDSNIKRMKAVLQQMMELTGKEKFKTELFSFGIQNNPPSVKFADEYVVPSHCLVPQEPKVDKKKLLEFLKNGGYSEGCEIVQTRSLRIR